jgi:hypothetical protein
MRRLLLVVLLLGCSLALDTQRTGVHDIDANLTDHATYTDTLYGAWAENAREFVEDNETAYAVIRSRMPKQLQISETSVKADNDSVTLSASGLFTGFIEDQGGGRYKISGRGFIDTICTEMTPIALPKIDQEFDFEIRLPPALSVIQVPESREQDLEYMYYNYSASYSNGVARQHLRLVVKEDVNVFDYCEEREGVSQLLQQGFIAVEKKGAAQASPEQIITTIIITIGLSATLYWLSR